MLQAIIKSRVQEKLGLIIEKMSPNLFVFLPLEGKPKQSVSCSLKEKRCIRRPIRPHHVILAADCLAESSRSSLEPPYFPTNLSHQVYLQKPTSKPTEFTLFISPSCKVIKFHPGFSFQILRAAPIWILCGRQNCESPGDFSCSDHSVFHLLSVSSSHSRNCLIGIRTRITNSSLSGPLNQVEKYPCVML